MHMNSNSVGVSVFLVELYFSFILFVSDRAEIAPLSVILTCCGELKFAHLRRARLLSTPGCE